VSLADVERLRNLPESAVGALAGALRGAGLDERFLGRIARVGERLDDPLRIPMRVWHARRMPEPAAVAARLFLLHDPVRAAEAEALLGDVEPWRDAGLVVASGARVTSPARLALAGPLFVFGDRDTSEGGIPPLNPVTALLARAVLPAAVECALDLGCGAGALALAMARTARRVIATDVDPRALAWTAFNARLNGLSNVELRHGDLFAPVGGERFDRIVSQPPFVATSARTSIYAHGGARGDELPLRALAGAASCLKPGGRALFLADWPLLDGDPLDGRVRTALGSGPDAIVLQSPPKNLDEYCVALAAGEHPELGDAFGSAACALRDHFEALGIRAVAQALVVIEPGAGHTSLVAVKHAHDGPLSTEAIDRVVAAHRLSWSPDAELRRARVRLPSGTRLVRQPEMPGVPPAVIVQLAPERPEWPFALSPEAAQVLQLADAGEIPPEGIPVVRDSLRRGALEPV
jgi:SAM-dependent methyltransferase